MRSPVAKYVVIKIGKALSIEELSRKPAPRGRPVSPRDADLAKLVNEVSAGPESQVLPWEFDGKAATARAAAAKVIKQVGAKVYLSSRRDLPGVLLFSRVPLSSPRGRRG